MDTEIFSLNGYNNGCNGYATLKRGADSITVGFSFKNLRKALLCLYCEDKVYPCGTLTPSRPHLEMTLKAKGAVSSFGVFCGTDCIAFNGSGKAFDAMNKYVTAGIAADPRSCSSRKPRSSAQTKPSSAPRDNADSKKQTVTKNIYYEKNRDFFSSVMDNSKHIERLELLMPSSKWVTAPEGYILGIIYDEDRLPLYICYGIEGRKSQQVPPDLAPYCFWLSDKNEKGWWVIYQSPKNGEALPIK